MASPFLTSAQAAELLEVTRATLYAYVSRGLLHSLPAAEGRRNRLYRRDEVLRLRSDRERRRDPSRIAETALSWGAPVLESALTLIADGKLYYRGHDVETLSRTLAFEDVAELLWLGRNDHGLFAAPAAESEAERDAGLDHLARLLLPFQPVERMQAMLPLAASRDLAAYDLRSASAARCGARIVRLLSRLAVLGPRTETPPPTALALQRAWCPGEEGAAALFDSTLILCADHELNVSSFTARTVASARSTLYDVVAGGIAALRGSRHGGCSELMQGLLGELWTAGQRSAGAVRDRLGRRQRMGERLPGFGHRLYPNGDPRCRILLERLEHTLPTSPHLEFGIAVREAAHELTGEPPNLDFSLGLLALAFDLPPGSALALFALGRSAGWIGHALEQYGRPGLIRPRARYSGTLPRLDGH